MAAVRQLEFPKIKVLFNCTAAAAEVLNSPLVSDNQTVTKNIVTVELSRSCICVSLLLLSRVVVDSRLIFSILKLMRYFAHIEFLHTNSLKLVCCFEP